MKVIAPLTGQAHVVGLTGSPGVGKSTVTGALVRAYREQGLRVGVLAVDPSSPFSGGALLGDRVRMQDHATDDQVFIRSMASRGHLGGLSWATPQALRILAAAGFDVVLDRDRRRRPGRGRDRVARRHRAGRRGAGSWRLDPGGEGGHPGDRRRVRGEQERPAGRAGSRQGPAHDAGDGPLRQRRLEAADRQHHGGHRRGHRRSRRPRSTSTATGSTGTGQRDAAAAGPGRARRSPRSRSASCGSGWAACQASRGWTSSPAGCWRAISTRTPPPTS